MKTQCLMMMTVLHDLLDERSWLPDVIFAPDDGPDFAYVEKEKGMISFDVTVLKEAAHGSRPFLGVNTIERMMAFYAEM